MSPLWPGGPPHPGEDPQGVHRRAIRTMEARTRSRDRARREGMRQARRARLLLGLVTALGLAGFVGWGIGRRARASAEELRAEQEAASRKATGLDAVLKGQSNKIIQQMWLTEIMEAQRSR